MKRRTTILAVGADIKNRALIGAGAAVHFGPRLGDLGLAGNYDRFTRGVARLIRAIGRRPDTIACDLHPGYFSTEYAGAFARRYSGTRLCPVQHHHAHIASVLYEQKIKKPVIGVAFDGTGYGSDGHMWGGEFFSVDRRGAERLGHLSYRTLPGGDAVVAEPWRMVLSILGNDGLPFLRGIKKSDIALVRSMIEKGINAPLGSSAGRLFDAAAALLGICRFASREAEGPMKLERLCDTAVNGGYDYAILSRKGCYSIDTDGVFRGMAKDLKRKKAASFIATKFHNSMARLITDMARKLSRKTGIRAIVLSGGVFQNAFLKGRVTDSLTASKFEVFTNKDRSVTDLNIALGQYFVCSGL